MSAFFSDRARWLKALGLWAIFLSMVILYGRFEAHRYNTGIVPLFEASAIPEEGLPFALSFTRLRPGPPLEIQTPLGWRPLVLPEKAPGQAADAAPHLGLSTSVIGHITSDGTILAESLHYHPLRAVKTWLSLATLVAFLGLGALRPRYLLAPEV